MLVLYPLLICLGSLMATAAPLAAETVCTTIKIPPIPGLKVLSITGVVQTNYSAAASGALNPAPLSGLNFCDVEVVVTRPSANDTVRIAVYLPLSDWNGRFQGQGGGGFATQSLGLDGKLSGLARGVSNGYAVASTDGGHLSDPWSPATWALNKQNQVNWPLLMNFASRSLHDMTVVGKAVTKSFYGKPPIFSYYHSCSTGGRHGLALAQKYPDDYDGISANAPALYYPSISAAGHWAQVVMQTTGVYPTLCEFQAFLNASIAACDKLDGVVDGVIDRPASCNYSARDLIGTTIQCPNNKNITITATAATIMNQIWDGPRFASGSRMWYGVNKGTNPTIAVNSTVLPNGTTIGIPNPLSENWIKYFVAKDPSFTTSTITPFGLERIFNQSKLEYDSILATDSPDLSSFQARGGKLITWHGLADEIIPANGTLRYLDSVKQVLGTSDDVATPVVNDFYRLFLAPGVGHCGGGLGAVPVDPLAAVVAWVEKGQPPDVLPAVAVDAAGKKKSRNLCPYPLVSTYTGKGDVAVAESYACVKS